MVVEQEVGNVKLCTAADRVLRRHYLHQHRHRRREFIFHFLTKRVKLNFDAAADADISHFLMSDSCSNVDKHICLSHSSSLVRSN